MQQLDVFDGNSAVRTLVEAAWTQRATLPGVRLAVSRHKYDLAASALHATVPVDVPVMLREVVGLTEDLPEVRVRLADARRHLEVLQHQRAQQDADSRSALEALAAPVQAFLGYKTQPWLQRATTRVLGRAPVEPSSAHLRDLERHGAYAHEQRADFEEQLRLAEQELHNCEQEFSECVLALRQLQPYQDDLEAWATNSTKLFEAEDLLLTEIASRRRSIRHLVNGVAEELGMGMGRAAADEHDATAATDDDIVTLAQKIVIFADTYGTADAPPFESVRNPYREGPHRDMELASIMRDVSELLGVHERRAAQAEQELFRQVGHVVERETGVSLNAEELAASSPYLGGVLYGAFAAYGQQDPVPPSSFDDHYRGALGDDWAYGVVADIGPSGTDEESYDEMDRARVWDAARALRRCELDEGRKSISYAASPLPFVDAPEQYGEASDAAIQQSEAALDPHLEFQLQMVLVARSDALARDQQIDHQPRGAIEI